MIATSRSIKKSSDDDILAVPGDIADRKTAERVIRDGVARFGRIDTLVNNAGIFIAKPFTQIYRSRLCSIVAVNLTGFFHITQLAIAEMEKRKSGHIVQITTSLVDQANSEDTVRARVAEQRRTEAATKSLAIEYAGRGIRVNAVSPGIIKTPMNPSRPRKLADLHPLGRMADISDVVGAILYLESAGFVTGEILHVDGGQAAGH